MKVCAEPFAWVFRIYAGDCNAPFSPYQGAMTVTIDDQRVATLRGLVSNEPFSVSAWAAVEAALADIGVSEYIFTRVHNGRKRSMRRKVRGG